MKISNKTSSCCYRVMYFPVLFWIILHKVGLISDLSIPPDAKADLKAFWLIRVGQNTLQKKKETAFGSIQKIKCNHLKKTHSFSELSKVLQPETEDKRSLNTNCLVCLTTCPSDSPAALNTGLKLAVVNIVTWPKWQDLKHSRQLARLQFTGLLFIQHCKVRENNRLVCFQRCEEYYAYVTDGSVNWKISSSYRSSGRFSSPSAKNVGNGGFLLQSL